jgi:glycerophosphoryl diester phosphodiesterase
VIDIGRRGGRLLRIGHRGAAALASENTLESLELAVGLGCDLVEFDVFNLPDGRLVLAHDRPRKAGTLPSLDEALAFLAATNAGAHLDLKARGAEREVAKALRRHGLVERTLVSSFRAATLRVLGAAEPGVRLGLTYPQDRTGLAQRRIVTPVVRPALYALRRALVRRVEGMLRRAGATAAVLHWQVVTGPVVARCHELGVPVLVWTVDDPAVLARLDELGVDGVVTNDPDIFGVSDARTPGPGRHYWTGH